MVPLMTTQTDRYTPCRSTTTTQTDRYNTLPLDYNDTKQPLQPPKHHSDNTHTIRQRPGKAAAERSP